MTQKGVFILVKKGGKKMSAKEKKVTKKKKSLGLIGWFKEAFKEFKKVRWPSRKEMIKYSIATIVFILFFALFFYLIEIIIFFIKGAM